MPFLVGLIVVAGLGVIAGYKYSQKPAPTQGSDGLPWKTGWYLTVSRVKSPSGWKEDPGYYRIKVTDVGQGILMSSGDKSIVSGTPVSFDAADVKSYSQGDK